MLAAPSNLLLLFSDLAPHPPKDKLLCAEHAELRRVLTDFLLYLVLQLVVFARVRLYAVCGSSFVARDGGCYG